MPISRTGLVIVSADRPGTGTSRLGSFESDAILEAPLWIRITTLATAGPIIAELYGPLVPRQLAPVPLMVIVLQTSVCGSPAYIVNGSPSDSSAASCRRCGEIGID